jgi:hypothetical protein
LLGCQNSFALERVAPRAIALGMSKFYFMITWISEKNTVVRQRKLERLEDQDAILNKCIGNSAWEKISCEKVLSRYKSWTLVVGLNGLKLRFKILYFCTNIWRHPVLLVHADIDDKDIRYILAHQKQQQTKMILSAVLSICKFWMILIKGL